MSEVRQRPPRPTTDSPAEEQRTTKRAPQFPPSNNEDATSTFSISLLDILRVILTIFVSSCVLSYFITNESVFWGYRPWFTRLDVVRSYLRGPLLLTPEQLSLYNGTDPTLPIYISINHTVFDVSVSRHTYGPGGSYQFFAGRDATRAFVTGCFAEDLTGDMRGVEEMYLSFVDEGDEEVVKLERELGSRERKVRREREGREARKQVRKQVEHWEGFYKGSKKYHEVGRLVDGEGMMGEKRELCEAARAKRPKRTVEDYGAT